MDAVIGKKAKIIFLQKKGAAKVDELAVMSERCLEDGCIVTFLMSGDVRQIAAKELQNTIPVGTCADDVFKISL